MRRHLDAWLVPAPTMQIDEIASAPERSRRIYLERLLTQGISPIAVGVTTCDIAPLELAVVRVVAPGMCLNTPAAFPLLGALRRSESDASAVARQAPPLPYA